MARSVNKILALSVLALLIGIIIAYYNTSSFGYDDANILSFTPDAVRVFDIYIRYSDIHRIIDFLRSIIPAYFITI